LTVPNKAEKTVDNPEKIMVPVTEEDLVTKEVMMDLYEDLMEPDPDESTAVAKY
jgi:hypothetical protein